MTTVINGIDMRAMDPPNPDLAIPKMIIAGTTQRKNKRLISIS